MKPAELMVQLGVHIMAEAVAPTPARHNLDWAIGLVRNKKP